MQRTFRYIISAILALVALSCDKLRDDASFKYIPIPVPEMISARISALESAMKSSRASGLIEDAPESWDDMEGVVTRTYAVADPNTIDPETGEVGEYEQYWSEGDQISLFVTQANLQYQMVNYSGGKFDQGEFRLVGDKISGAQINTEYYYSVYPYKENTTINNSGVVTYEFPKTQHYSGDTYASGENGMIAREPKNGTDSLLYFQNFCSYLQLRLVAIEGQPKVVKKITLTSNDTKNRISGAGIISIKDGESIPQVKMSTEPGVTMRPASNNLITLDCGNGVELSSDENAPTKFWFVVPGGIQFTSGFSVSVIYDNNYYYTKSTQKKIGIQRSHIKPMATFKPVAMEANEPIRYKYNDPTIKEPFPLANSFFGEGGAALDIIDQVYDEETGEWVVMLSGTLKTIGDNSFIGPGENLEYIKVVNGEEPVTISNFAFYNCTADSLMVHNPIDQIKSDAFKSSTIKDINIYGDVNTINTGVSADSKIENLVIKGNVGTICEESFNLKGTSVLISLDIRGDVETIEKNAFEACESLAEVKIGGNVGTIEQEAFSGCHNLEVVSIKGNIDIIGAKVFYDNDLLHTMDINGNIAKIQDQAFYDCDALETFHIEGGVAEIGKQAFGGCESLNFVDIHGDIGTIGEEAFIDCEILDKVHVNGNIATIGPKAFYDCDGLTQLLIDGHVDVIEKEAFASCDELAEVNLYGDVKTIGEKAFNDTDKLQTVHITGNVETINEAAFQSCDMLKDVIIDGSVTSIGKHVFNGCTKLQTISALSAESIGFEAFVGCANLTEADLPGIKYIDNAAFQNCTNLASINLDSIITIGDAAFWACSSLTSIEIGENCTMIGEGAFCHASNLKDVYCYAVKPPLIKTDNLDGSFVFGDTAAGLCIYVPAESLSLYLNMDYFQDQYNWWYWDYENNLKGITKEGGNL